MEECSICGKQVKAIKQHHWKAHGDGKTHNPNKGYALGSREAWNKGKSKQSDDRIAKHAEALSVSKKGVQATGCCAWTKEQRSESAKKQGFGGYQENAGKSMKFKVKDSFGKDVTLQSSYELRCSQILDELGIAWLRPRALMYDGRRYFADFYLPDHDIWLDPKNSFKAKQDAQKIQSVSSQNNVSLYVLLEEHITKDYISSLTRQLKGLA